MARTFRNKDRLGALSEINITPLIDLAFALLIIFMIATPLIEQSIPIELPKKDTEFKGEKSLHFETISINREGTYFWGREPVNSDELKQKLAQIAAQANPPVLNIRADHALPYQAVVTLLDMITAYRLTKINLRVE